MQMAIGAALAETAAKTVCLVGDGGLMVNVGELATAVQENANVMIVLMNDQCYGVIRNIQDAQYGGRRCFVDLHQPDFAQFCESLKLTHYRIKSLDRRGRNHPRRLAKTGPVLVEVDMLSVGSFATAFAGPPVKEAGA
jgi:acetolactate synthase-1/2/3 large subunit